MARLERGWVKDEFSAPRSIWKTALDQKCKIIYLYLVDQLEEGGDPVMQKSLGHAPALKEHLNEQPISFMNWD